MNARTYSHRDLVALLATAMGHSEATQVVETMCTKHAAAEPMSFDDAKKILSYIADLPGLAGVTGRVAVARLGSGGGWSSRGSSPPSTVKRRSISFVIDALSASVGEERARDVVSSAAAELQIPDGPIAISHALLILEQIAKMPGALGIAARFAKGRIHLSW
jgi:hypothetical protein